MFPIVLAHGIARFDIFRHILAERLNLPADSKDDRLQYFKNVRTHLNRNGYSQVRNTNVNFAGSVALRSAELKTQIEDFLAETGAPKVHIIAHSMGGLDARRMIVRLGMAEKVASLTTIGTPHHGSLAADEIIKNGGKMWIEALKKYVHLDSMGIFDLTLEACANFNREAEDSEAKNGVFYQTFSSYDRQIGVFFPLLGSWSLLNEYDGANDGLVAVSSQEWTSELVAADGTRKEVVRNKFPIRADHLNEVGWWNLSEAVAPLTGAGFLTPDQYELRIKNVYLDIVRNLPN